jgi:hypothetical protein
MKDDISGLLGGGTNDLFGESVVAVPVTGDENAAGVVGKLEIHALPSSQVGAPDARVRSPGRTDP